MGGIWVWRGNLLRLILFLTFCSTLWAISIESVSSVQVTENSGFTSIYFSISNSDEKDKNHYKHRHGKPNKTSKRDFRNGHQDKSKRGKTFAGGKSKKKKYSKHRDHTESCKDELPINKSLTSNTPSIIPNHAISFADDSTIIIDNSLILDGEGTISLVVNQGSESDEHMIQIEVSRCLDNYVQIISPVNGVRTNNPIQLVEYKANDTLFFDQEYPLENEGLNIVLVEFVDRCNVTHQDSLIVELDTQCPEIKLISHNEVDSVLEREVELQWSVDGEIKDSSLILNPGLNDYSISESDELGNTCTQEVSLEYFPEKDVKIVSPQTSSVTTNKFIPVIWSIDGNIQEIENQENLIDGVNAVIRSVTDQFNRTFSDTITVIKVANTIVPDLIQQTEDLALKLLDESYLNVGEVHYGYSSIVDSSLVFVQSQPPGREVSIDDKIDIVISLGSSTLPDLSIEGIQLNGYELEYQIVNHSDVNLFSDFQVTVWMDVNLNEKIDPNEKILSEYRYYDQLPSQSTQSQKLNLSQELPFINAPLAVMLDVGNEIDEVNELNNFAQTIESCDLSDSIGVFDPVVFWRWQNNGSYDHVMMTPIVVQLNDDNSDGLINELDYPDIVFTAFNSWYYKNPSHLVALSGKDGSELWKINNKFQPGNNIVAGDLNNDGIVEIVAMKGYDQTTNSTISIISNTGKILSEIPYQYLSRYGTITDLQLADVNSDGQADIITNHYVFSYEGDTLAYFEDPIKIVEDINLDGKYEIITNKGAFDLDSNIAVNWDVVLGHIAFGNFNEDPNPEIVNIQSGMISLYNVQGEVLWGPFDIPPDGIESDYGGPPTLADFNGDGRLNIGVSAGLNYVVYNYDGSILWTLPIQDRSSSATSSSAVDLEGDGKTEILMNDESYFRIVSGEDGKELFRFPKSSGTLREYPVVSDVDNDGSLDIIVVGNYSTGYTPYANHGVSVISSQSRSWVNTRKIWNQHNYRITNVNDDGSLPQYPQNNWDSFNNFRCQQSNDALSCADVNLDKLSIQQSCDSLLQISLRVGNAGKLPIPQGTETNYYAVDIHGDTTTIGSQPLEQTLTSGEWIDMSYEWRSFDKVQYEIIAIVNESNGERRQLKEAKFDNNVVSAIVNVCNQPPILNNVPSQFIPSGTDQYKFEINYQDEQDVTFNLIQGPVGLTIESNLSLIHI